MSEKRVAVRTHERRWPKGRGKEERYLIHAPRRGFVTRDLALAERPDDDTTLKLGEAEEVLEMLHGTKAELWRRIDR